MMNPNETKNAHLFAELSALGPVNGISAPGPGTSEGVVVTFRPGATLDQVAAVNAALAAFDWSDAAHNAWLDATFPDKRGFVNAVANALAGNAAYVGLAAPTQAQTAAQVKNLTRQVNRIIRRLAQFAD